MPQITPHKVRNKMSSKRCDVRPTTRGSGKICQLPTSHCCLMNARANCGLKQSCQTADRI
jgi:hypothetical protein